MSKWNRSISVIRCISQKTKNKSMMKCHSIVVKLYRNAHLQIRAYITSMPLTIIWRASYVYALDTSILESGEDKNIVQQKNRSLLCLFDTIKFKCRLNTGAWAAKCTKNQIAVWLMAKNWLNDSRFLQVKFYNGLLYCFMWTLRYFYV